MAETCDMVILEDGDLQYWWECTKCLSQNKATAKFEKSKVCPNCGAKIEMWVGIDDGDED